MDELLKKIWVYVTKGQDVPVEVSLFRLITLTMALLCIFVIFPTNIIQHLSPYLNATILAYGLLSLFCFFQSRQGTHRVTTFYLLTLVVLNIAWFLNAGSQGSIGYYFSAAVLYPLIFFREAKRHLLFVLLLADSCTLLLIEHTTPWLIVPFHTPNDRLIDLITGSIFSATTCALVFWTVISTLERELEERKRAEASIKEGERTLRTLMDTMPAAVRWFDEDGTIKYQNNCFLETFGYELTEIPTLTHWLERAYPDPGYRNSYLKERNQQLALAQEQGTTLSPYETKITCKDGRVRHVIIRTQSILERTVEIMTDITEREQIHDQMLKIQKLESLGLLAGGIAHDFNNILTSIVGNVTMAQLLLDPAEQASGCLNQAEKACQRAAELSKQLLTFAKKGEPIKKPVQVARLLEESLSLSLRGSPVITDLDIAANLLLTEADEGQLSQVFNNIIINAAQAMPNGGRLTVAAANITLSATNNLNLPAGEYLAISFTDEGTGIAEDDLKYIFDPYFTTKQGGTGLGLASTHSIITRHGGNISVASSLGAGTTFTITLRACSETASELPAEEEAPVTPSGACILVMDDEEMILDYIQKVLREYGYLVDTCTNGEDAVARYQAAALKGTPYAAVILDMTIRGGIGGKEAAQQLLGIDNQARIIVSSGYTNDLTLSEWQQHGFSGYLPKPYVAAELLKVVGRIAVSSPSPDAPVTSDVRTTEQATCCDEQ
ncbi:hybrid sensor histidine kinase/response regulator [Geomonas agri]|uniref:hybrid sensor histidine kinase/response regulator n=1 Tax=Geomonas agri TaxID=2873702 RepID=UPI001CD2625F|nr:ATP-binding protein [Geomonas agri]